MTVECYESGNRRAEITGSVVAFLRCSGNVRRSVSGVWWIECDDLAKARRLARRWVLKGKLGKPVVH